MLTLLVFTSTHCGVCRMMEPIIDQIEDAYDIEVVTVNTDVSTEIPEHFGIKSTPTFVFVVNNQVVEKFVGARTKAFLIKTIERILNDQD